METRVAEPPMPKCFTIPTLRQVSGGGISRSRAYELIADGILDARKIGRLTVVTAESVDRYLASLPPAPIRRRATAPDQPAV